MSLLGHQFEPDLSAHCVGEGTAHSVRGKAGFIANLSITRKLNFAVYGGTILLATLALITILGALHLSDRGREQIILASIEVRTNNAAIALNDALDGLRYADQSAQGDALAAARSNVEMALVALNDPIDFADGDLPADLGPELTAFRDRTQALEQQLSAPSIDTESRARIAAETEQLYTEVSQFAVQSHPFISNKAEALYNSIGVFIVGFMFIASAGLAIVLFGSRLVVRDVVGKLREVTAVMSKVAAGEHQIAIPGGNRRDEIGDMARALSVFRDTALELSGVNKQRAGEAEAQLEKQVHLAEQMRILKHDKSLLLENLADEFEVSIGELITSVSSASQQLKATSSQMVGVADGSNKQADSASAAMKNASHNVTAAAAATDEFALSIHEISQQASASANLAREATDLVASANTRMTDLSEAADEVGEIAELIQTIAQRTNLLALNASIEAARGGEAGRGFAVVASEVKELALQTSAATKSVAERIGAMQLSTRSSADDLSSIFDQIGELEKVAVVIATAVDQQSASGEELARNIDTVAEGSRDVSERLIALRKASEETGGAAGDVVESANALGKHADDLREKAGRFIADVRRSARELEFENEGEDAAPNSKAA